MAAAAADIAPPRSARQDIGSERRQDIARESVEQGDRQRCQEGASKRTGAAPEHHRYGESQHPPAGGPDTVIKKDDRQGAGCGCEQACESENSVQVTFARRCRGLLPFPHHPRWRACARLNG